ncbi:hypothetical protein GCM10009118_25400 [Wandonia haliotis]|uniref:Haem-binding uptake Tiki superfamily ChaN domain-containing protein n=1 Tax=Wandonia haliotis TaxID=574963 RepID=A0ABP3Y3V4_9FLAO
MRSSIVTVIIVFFCVFNFDAQVINVSEIRGNISCRTKIILLGENHSGRERYNVLDQYIEILTQNEIDTVFIEMPYSEYFEASIGKNDYQKLKLDSFKKSNIVIIPIDIESDLLNALNVIREVYYENFLSGSEYYREHSEITYQLFKTKKLNIPFLMDYLGRIRTHITPLLLKYQSEFLTLIQSIEETYINFEVYESGNLDDSIFRDSLMALKIKRYVQENSLQKWGGFFGSMHISQPEDGMFKLVDIQNNMISFLLKEGVLYATGPNQNYSRIIYDSVRKIEQSKKFGVLNNTFLDEFKCELRKVKKGNIFFLKKNKTYWCVSKK